MNRGILVGLAMGLIVALSTSAQAEPFSHDVFIQNPSFEDPQLDDGWTATQFIGWQLVDPDSDGQTSGVLNPSWHEINDLLAVDGQNVTIVWAPEYLRQIQAEKIQANMAYDLSALVGNLKSPFIADPDYFASAYSVQLRAGGDLLAKATSPLPSGGYFETCTARFEALPGDPHVGMPIEVRLVPFDKAVLFDNVQLTATPVPEPSAACLLATAGVIALVQPRRRAFSRVPAHLLRKSSVYYCRCEPLQYS